MIYIPRVEQGTCHAIYKVDSICLIYYLSLIINHSMDILSISTMFSLKDKH